MSDELRPIDLDFSIDEKGNMQNLFDSSNEINADFNDFIKNKRAVR